MANLTRRDRAAFRKVRTNLSCEALEARQLLATRIWAGTNSADPNWMTAGNWDGGVAPVANDTLVFSNPSGAIVKTTNNDFAADTPFQIEFDTSGYTLTGNEVAISGGLAVVAQNPSGGNDIQLPLLLTGDASVTVNSPATLTLDGDVAGGSSSGLTKVGAGTLVLTMANSYTGTTTVNSGTLQVDGALGPISLDGGTLGGNGTVGSVTATGAGGVVSPGDSPGILNTGDLALTPTSSLNVEIDGTAPGVGGYDQVNVTGAVNLGSAGLSVALGYNPGPTDSFVIVNNDGTDPITGTFAGLPQGSIVTATAPNGASVQLLVSYSGGDGNDVVLSVNGPPVAGDDFYTLPGNTTLLVPAPGVLTNDFDPNPGDPLQPVLVTGPIHGTLTLFGDGSFQYDPAPGYSGPDSFTYRASDGHLTSNLATVSLVVNAQNLPPTANDDSYTSLENTTLTIPTRGVLANDFSPDNAALTATLTAQLLAGPANASAFTLNADGSFTYTPKTDFVGTDQFTYRARDTNGLGSMPATVVLTIGVKNVAPTATDDTFTLTENKDLFVVGPGVLANDTDPNKDSLSAFLVSAPLHGSLTLGGDGSIIYTPNANYNGKDSFTYSAFDGQIASAPATVTLNITAVNVAPVAVNDNYVATEDGKLTVSATDGVLANDTDVDAGQTLTAAVVNGPLFGTLALAADGSFVYTPNPNFNGTDSFTYKATDNGTPPLSSNVATVTITVQPINHAPVAAAETYTTNEDVPLAVAAPGVLANDTDADGDTLSAVLVSGPMHGTVALASDGSFVYTPDPNFNGTGASADTFTYMANDGKANSAVTTVTINVNPVPDTPVTAPDAFTTNEDTVLTVAAPGLLLNDQNPDGGALTIVVLNGPQHGALVIGAANDGSLTYTPSANYFGTDSFTYYLKLGMRTSNVSTVTLTVLPVNDPPVVADDAYTTNEDTALIVAAPGVLLNDHDVDGDPMSAVLQVGPTHGTLTLNSDGSFVYTPAANYNGPDSFVYRASDGQSQSATTATVSLTVLPVNDAPVAGNDTFTIPRDQRLTVPAPGILANDSDVEGSPLSAVLVNPPLNGVLALGADGSFVYTPNLNFSGTDTFTYRASDGALTSNLATVTINVTPYPQTTVQLDAASDTGFSNTDRITKDNTPTFFGTAIPNLQVLLYARPAGSSAAPTVVGRTVADSAGNFVVTSSPLPDGQYEFSVSAIRADGLSTGIVSAGNLVIDTVAPKILGAFINPKTGQIYLTFKDDRGGMDVASEMNVKNYVFLRPSIGHPRANLITKASAQPVVSPTDQQLVVLRSADGKRVIHGRYLFSVISGGVQDAAGNALDGEFNGSYPSGNNVPGGNFNAEFLNGGHARSAPVPTDQFIPVVVSHGKGAKVHPAGTLVHTKRHRRGH